MRVRRGVSAGGRGERGGGLEARLCRLLLAAYPPAFRRECGADYAAHVRSLCASAGGARGRLWVWCSLLADTVRNAPGERWRERGRPERQGVAVPAMDGAGALVSGAAVLLLYVVTLAPTAAFWDAGEYITVAHVLGIPHPPGNPLFVVVARAWELLLSPTGLPVAVRVNLLSAASSAAAHALLYLLIERSLFGGGWTRGARRVAAAAAVAVSATAFTVWHQSNVNEKVYTLSLLTVLAGVWLVVRWRDTRSAALLLLAVYLTALTMANHMMGLLAAPALIVYVLVVDRRVLLRPRFAAACMLAAAVALSAHFYLPVRAAWQPLVNEASPECGSAVEAAASVYTLGATGCPALSASLRREQYQKPSVLRDPNDPRLPRSAALLGAQFVNYAQYVDWQWARGLGGGAPLFGWPRPLFTMLMLLLAAVGARTHFRADRAAAALHGGLLLTFSVGLVLYLNFRYGYTHALERVPDRALHEVRERDYFFLIGFSLLGAWAGLGIAAVWRRTADLVAAVTRLPRIAAVPVLGLALVPLVLNGSWAARTDDWTARDWAYNVLMSVEPYGILVTNGDNDSFPLWYLQHVERIREDVTVVLSPYLGTSWYARQIRDISAPCPQDVLPERDASRIICQRAFSSAQVHPRLLAAWGGVPERVPEDSILPLSDAQLHELAQTWFVPQEPLQLRAGALVATIPPGTAITPVDTFMAAIIQHSYGVRPIHFMSPSRVAARLGLEEHTVRTGLTWRLRVPGERDSVVPVPGESARGTLGAFIDLATTDTLSRDVFLVRGRVTDPRRPWVDHATYDIPLQYVLMHVAAAHAHEAAGGRTELEHHLNRLDFWNRIPGG